jgi:hypothetical protein
MRFAPSAGVPWALALLLPAAALLGAIGMGWRADAQAVALRAASATCAPRMQETLRMEIEALRRLQQLARREGDRLCAGLEAADGRDLERLIDPNSLQSLLSDHQRKLLDALGIDLARVDVGKVMRLLGIDPPRLDLQALKQQCRRSQDGIERFASEELGRLEQEVARCDGRI